MLPQHVQAEIPRSGSIRALSRHTSLRHALRADAWARHASVPRFSLREALPHPLISPFVRTLVQLSDLHFGSILAQTLQPLLDTVWALQPDLTIVSGDITQRARREEFRDASAFIARLPQPRLLVPGNHDVPLYDVLRRFLSPLSRYASSITSDLAPVYVDAEVAVVGINTARSLVFKGGRVSAEQRDVTRRAFAQATAGQVRIVVAHHPFEIPEGLSGVAVVEGADEAVALFAECGVDLVMTGHLHLVHIGNARRYVPGYAAPLVGAGTATSTRARGEANSFVVYRIDAAQIATDIYTWIEERNAFRCSATHYFERQARDQPTIHRTRSA